VKMKIFNFFFIHMDFSLKMQQEHFLKYRGPNCVRTQGLASYIGGGSAKSEDDYLKPITFHFIYHLSVLFLM
jgi:hypothetical protein